MSSRCIHAVVSMSNPYSISAFFPAYNYAGTITSMVIVSAPGPARPDRSWVRVPSGSFGRAGCHPADSDADHEGGDRIGPESEGQIDHGPSPVFVPIKVGMDGVPAVG